MSIYERCTQTLIQACKRDQDAARARMDTQAYKDATERLKRAVTWALKAERV